MAKRIEERRGSERYPMFEVVEIHGGQPAPGVAVIKDISLKGIRLWSSIEVAVGCNVKLRLVFLNHQETHCEARVARSQPVDVGGIWKQELAVEFLSIIPEELRAIIGTSKPPEAI